MNTGIDYSPSFEQWQAMVAANATLEEILKWENGEYPVWFMARLIAWYRGSVQVTNHTQDAISASVSKK